MTKSVFRIGQIVPSSNVTMETETRHAAGPGNEKCCRNAYLHSSRTHEKVTKEELTAMDADLTAAP